jgi:hypothetical protein
MRTVIRVVSLLDIAAALDQDAPTLWRDPEASCPYFRLGDTVSLRHQRDRKISEMLNFRDLGRSR